MTDLPNLKDVQVARIVNNSDPEFMILEVVKNQNVSTFTVQEGDEFITFVFVRRGDNGRVETWNPFK